MGWSALNNQPSFSADTMLLLTDGTVMCHELSSSNWHQLTPDSTGSYINGTWSSLAPFPPNPVIPASVGGPTNAPLYFASAVLSDGRVFTAGGEYNSGNSNADITATQIYDPVADAWTNITSPPGITALGDAACCMLADGRILIGTSSDSSTATAILDPSDLSWVVGGAKADSPSEESWALLPNGNVLTVECSNSPNAEQYNPTTNTWISAGSTPSDLTQPCAGSVAEIGPFLLLPDGRVFCIGASGSTALYTPKADPTVAGTWASGPNLVDGSGNPLSAMDAPGVLLPNGTVLLAASPSGADPNGVYVSNACNYPSPTSFLTYDPSTNKVTDITGPSNSGGPCYAGRLLLLPNGQVLFSNNSTTIEVFSPGGSPQAAWQPTITDAPSTMVLGHTYTLTGTQFNGLSQGCAYGDDAQMATNYPIARLSNGAGQVAYLRTSNFSTMGVATGNTPVTADVTVPNGATPGNWSLEVVANGIASNPVSVQIAAQDCFFILDNSTFSKGEIDTYVNAAPPVNAVFNPAFYVVVEGFTPSEMGIDTNHPIAPQLLNPPFVPSVPSPFPGHLTIAFAGPMIPQDPTLPAQPQRFTFPFSITFLDDSVFTAVANPVTLTATFAPPSNTVSNTGVITLTPNPNPFILHGDQTLNPPEPWYLSQDLKVFQVVASAGNSAFNASLGTSGSAQEIATTFIQAAVTNLRTDTTGTLAAEFNNLPQDEDSAVLQLQPNDPATNDPVYNFAIARVRLRDTINASNVRVFFRIWQAQQTNAEYNNITYARATNGEGQPIPVLGIQGDEIVTIPFFAEPRLDSSQPLHTQTDDFNRHDIDATAGETDYFFGCWLDINQPNATYYPQRIVNVSPDGPFNTISPLFPIQQFMVAAHQCLIAEIAYDLDPIVAPADPSSSDKLAQRNLAFVGAPNPGHPDSRRVPQTFEVKPTQPSLPKGVKLTEFKPDELMIEWEKVPAGSVAEVYFPAASADVILATASTLYTSHKLTRTDAHTLRFPAAGVTYLPIPKGEGVTFAGLLTLELPSGIHKGEKYAAIVRQITSVYWGFNGSGENNPELEADYVNNQLRQWRRTTGTFKLTIPVSTKALLLEPEERYLSIMKWVAQAIPVTSRWYLVMKRYLQQIEGRVTFMGGNPGIIPATGTGIWKTLPHPPQPHEAHCFIGKIESLIYDRFGDFEGFTLETVQGEFKLFESREPHLAELARTAWQDRIRVRIEVAPRHEHRPIGISFLI